MKATQLLTMIAAMSIFGSCKKENTNSIISYQLTATSPTSIVNRIANNQTINKVSGSTIQWDSGYASVATIKFEAKKDNSEIEFKNDVHNKVNLFDPLASIGDINLTPATYTEVEFKAELQSWTNNLSLQLFGKVINGSVTTPLIFTATNDIELKGEENNVTVSSGSDYSSLTTINLASLTQGIPASAFTNATQTNGVIVISESSNTSIYNSMINQLQHLEHEFHHH